MGKNDPVKDDGNCKLCGNHVATQGHRSDCELVQPLDR